MKLQEPYAERIDSDLVKRAKVEAANLLDREVDAVWLVRKQRSMVPWDISRIILRRLPLSEAAIRPMRTGRRFMI